MKILWLSSIIISEREDLASGTWVPGMYDLLKRHYPELEIVNLTKGAVTIPRLVETDYLREWIIPDSDRMTTATVSHIERIIHEEAPDVIQVWGTEDIWGMFPFERFPGIPAIIEIQGILACVSEEYYGGLSFSELVKCWNIKEFLKPSSSLPAIRRLYTRHVDREAEILRRFHNIGVQSAWSADVVRTFNQSARLFNSGIALRLPFYESPKWAYDCNNLRIFSTALIGQPLKGAYILFKAFHIVKKRFPEAQLILAGVKEEGIRQSGFCRMLLDFARKRGFEKDIIHVGKVSAGKLAELYRTSAVFVNPSNWESYSVVTAESMYIGCPTVAAYSGAMPELGADGSVLYFPKGDFRICAARIMDILENRELAVNLSEKSRAVGEARQDTRRIAEVQMKTYWELISSRV